MEKKLLEILAALGIDLRKMLKEQRELMSVHKILAFGLEELKAGLQELKAGHAQLMLNMKNMKEKWQVEDEEVWLTKEQVMEELCIGQRTFYRRRREGKWIVRVSGGQEYYLKSSLRKAVSR